MTISASPSVDFTHYDDPQDLLKADAEHASFVYVPYRRYLAVEGTDGPASAAFHDAIASLYPVGYTLHFALKDRGVSAAIGALEGVYWIDRPGPLPVELFSTSGSAGEMSWRLLLPIPDEATDEEVQSAIDEARQRRSGPPPAIDRVAVHGWLEAECAQLLHIGPYDAERPTLERLQAAVTEVGLRPRGCHHEIYLSGPGTAPARLRTIIRLPVEEIGW
jgi:hypothetical protein